MRCTKSHEPNATTAAAIRESELTGVIAQLRHAYMHLVGGTVKDQRQLAEGLIAPQIAKLERMAARERGA
jgi:hypothetical protein